MIFHDEDMPQGSQKWHDFRLSGVGASESPLLMGLIPPQWRTVHDLFLAKLGLEQPEANENMKRGTMLEPQARQYIENYLNHQEFPDKTELFTKNVKDFREIPEDEVFKGYKFEQLTASHPDCPQLFASLDGISKEKECVLEIKCPAITVFTKMVKTGQLPSYYMPQIQVQLLISKALFGIDRGLFCNFFPQGIYDKADPSKLVRLVVTETKLDEEYAAEILEKTKKFWKMVENRRWNRHWEQ